MWIWYSKAAPDSLIQQAFTDGTDTIPAGQTETTLSVETAHDIWDVAGEYGLQERSCYP